MADLLRTLYKVKKTEIEMMDRRGYDVSGLRPLLSLTYEEFASYYRSKMQKTGKNIYELLSSFYRNEKREYIYIYYSPEASASTGKAIVASFLSQVNSYREKYNLYKAIIISAKGLSYEANALLNSLPLYFVQSFVYSELTWNKTRHVLTDPHRILSQQEVASLSVSLEKMPLIKETDAMAKFLGAVPGDVVETRRRITQYPSTSAATLFYRYVRAEKDILGSI